MRKALMFLGALTVVVGLIAAPAGAKPPANLHCPGGYLYKVEAVGSELDDVVLPAGTEFCVKASTQNSSYLTADGTSTLLDYVTWLNNGGQTPSVSYYVVYRECEGYGCEPPCDPYREICEPGPS